MRILILFSFLTWIISICGAQKQANVWYFGKRIGINFNVDPPVLLLDGQIDYDETPDNLESAASIADENGNLLFYTNGVKVWNRLHQVMPNGTGLYGRNTTTQTLIVPKLGSSSLYYVFTASPEGDSDYFPIESRGFHYSVIDLSKNNGLGEVVEKNIKLVTSTTEKIAGTNHVNGKDVWVVMHEWNSRFFRAYLVTETGISHNPVISESGSIHSGGLGDGSTWNAIGQMKISPDGEKLALVTYISKQLEVFHFDPSNGKINLMFSKSLYEEGGGRLVGVEFSPSSRYLYFTENFCNVFQVDLNAEQGKINIVKISNTPPCDHPSQLQLAPDNKIYVAQFGESFIGVIEKPNEAGELSEFKGRAIEIPNDGIHQCNIGLPNFISSYFHDPEHYPANPYFQMPNVFTPNNDGYNDRFVPLMKYNVEFYNLVIYNRWGERVYQTSDLENGWDGQGFSQGIYYWLAHYYGINGKQRTQKGSVHLIR